MLFFCHTACGILIPQPGIKPCPLHWNHGVLTTGPSRKGCDHLLKEEEAYIYMKVLVDQSCPTLFDPMDYSLPGSSVHGILQARILEWVAIPFSRGSSQLRDRTWVFCTAGRFFTIRATREATYTYTYTFVPAQISSGKIYKKLEIVVASRKKAFFLGGGRVEGRLIFLYIPFGTNCMIMYLQYKLRKPS